MEVSKETANLRELAYVRLRPVFGKSTRSISSRELTLKSLYRSTRPGQPQNNQQPLPVMNDSKAVDFVYYSDSDEESSNEWLREDEGSYKLSCNFVQCIQTRERGDHRRFQTMRLSSEYGTRHMLSNAMMRESEISIGNIDKVFCSQWLSHKQVLFGTKCNKLMVLDVLNKKVDYIPSLNCSKNLPAPATGNAIHSIQINPSRTLLATVAKNSNNVAVYRLPTLDPVCVGETAHGDCIFDQAWIDDQFFVSGSRDGTISLWRITDEMLDELSELDSHNYLFTQPLVKKTCKQADKVRALCYNNRTQEFAALSLNGFIHCWNALTMKQIMSKRLPHHYENVCLATDEDCQLYSVGSKTHTDILDSRTLQSVKKIPSKNSGCGIRSVSFKGNILTIGTGVGLVLFWDLRASKFLESTMNSNRAVQLRSSKGWLERDEAGLEELQNNRYTPAIYTHCYDKSGTRLFAAGGPLQCGLKGNYIGLFQ